MVANGNKIKIRTEDNDADRKSAIEALAIAMQSRTAIVSPVPVVSSANISTITLSVALEEYKPYLFHSKIAEKSKRQAMSVLVGLKNLLGNNFEMSNLTDAVVEDLWFPYRLKTVAQTTAKRDLSFIRLFVVWASHRTRKYVPAK